jgi:hypothetical protein
MWPPKVGAYCLDTRCRFHALNAKWRRCTLANLAIHRGHVLHPDPSAAGHCQNQNQNQDGANRFLAEKISDMVVPHARRLFNFFGFH